MLKEKQRTFKSHTHISLERLVPEDHFYRELDAKLDLSFTRDLVKDLYCWWNGRGSVDPVVFFKLQLIMFFEGIRSERQLMEHVHLNLAFRWYIGYDLDEQVPHHSTLSNIRKRYGLPIFQTFFEKIVDLCREEGLVWGEELYFDGTKVRANASMDSLAPRFHWEAMQENMQQHLETLFQQELDAIPNSSNLPDKIGVIENAPSTSPPHSLLTHLVERYRDAREVGRNTDSYQRVSDFSVSTTDPDATPMRLTDQARAVMGYHDHYVVDGGKARIILAALVTPASVMDNTPLLDLVRWARFRFQLQPKIAVGDTKYGTAVNIGGLEQDGIRAYTPRTDYDARHPYYSYEMFEYDVEHDRYICPQGKFLTYHSNYAEDHVFFYKADPQDCNHCPVKEECTGGWEGRRIRRSHFQEYLDRAATYRDTEPYKKAMRKRKVWVEPLFGEAKDWHGLRRFRRRGIANVNIEAVMIASGQNLKRLLRAKGWRRCFPTPEAGAPALAVPIPTFFDLKKLLFRVQSAIVEQILSSEGQNPAPVRHKFFNTLCICRHFTHNHMRRIVLFPSP